MSEKLKCLNDLSDDKYFYSAYVVSKAEDEDEDSISNPILQKDKEQYDSSIGVIHSVLGEMGYEPVNSVEEVGPKKYFIAEKVYTEREFAKLYNLFLCISNHALQEMDDEHADKKEVANV